MLPKTYKKLIASNPCLDFRAAVSVVERDLLPPGPGQVLVKNAYAGVNAADLGLASGAYPPEKDSELDLGLEAVGEVVAVGPGVTHPTPGTRVATFLRGGGYREYFAVPHDAAIPIPRATPEATALVLSGVSAMLGLRVGEMRSRETVLVTAAAGSVGHIAVQLAKQAGNHVVAACGSQAKVAFLKELGCDRVIDYTQDDLAEVLRREYPKGIDLVFECVGKAVFEACIENMALRGRIVICGMVSTNKSGSFAPIPNDEHAKLILKSMSLRGFLYPHFYDVVPARFAELTEMASRGALRVHIDPNRFQGLESVAGAVEHLYQRTSMGKIVVQIAA